METKYRGIATFSVRGEVGMQHHKEVPPANDEANLPSQHRVRQEHKIASRQQTTCWQDTEHGRGGREVPLVLYRKTERVML